MQHCTMKPCAVLHMASLCKVKPCATNLAQGEGEAHKMKLLHKVKQAKAKVKPGVQLTRHKVKPLYKLKLASFPGPRPAASDRKLCEGLGTRLR